MKRLAGKIFHHHHEREEEHKDEKHGKEHPQQRAREFDRKEVTHNKGAMTHNKEDLHEKLDRMDADHKKQTYPSRRDQKEEDRLLGRDGYDIKENENKEIVGNLTTLSDTPKRVTFNEDHKMDNLKKDDIHKKEEKHIMEKKEVSHKEELSKPDPLERAVREGHSPVPQKHEHSFDTQKYKFEEGRDGTPATLHMDENTPLPDTQGVHFRTPIIEEIIQPVIVEVPQVVTKEEHINERVMKPIVYKKTVDNGETTTEMVGDFEKMKLATPEEHAKYMEYFGYSNGQVTPHTDLTKTPMQQIDLSQLDELNKQYTHHSKPIEQQQHQQPIELTKEQTQPISFSEMQEPTNLAKHTLPQQHLNEQGVATPMDEDYFKHNSLDIRAQLCVERLADLQAQGNSGLPTTLKAVHVQRGADDLERGSKIGLDH